MCSLLDYLCNSNELTKIVIHRAEIICKSRECTITIYEWSGHSHSQGGGDLREGLLPSHGGGGYGGHPPENI